MTGTARTSRRSGDRDVLLVFPGRHKAPDPQVPLQLLHVASALRRAGYHPRIADVRLGDFRTVPLGDPVFVGITAMSGPQIRYGLEFAERVRAERPGTPIVWGGVHPTLLPEQTAADPRVDVVVRGEGELVVGPLADALLTENRDPKYFTYPEKPERKEPESTKEEPASLREMEVPDIEKIGAEETEVTVAEPKTVMDRIFG